MRTQNQNFLILLVVFFAGCASVAQAFEWESAATRPNLLEAYVSQGCSSCPPVVNWVNTFVDDPDLWQKIIPLVFHVNYFDNLGWRDRFGTYEFTQRQYDYRAGARLRSIYTPALLLNGKEWWRAGNADELKKNVAAPRLSVQGDAKKIEAVFDGDSKGAQLNVAVLGFGLSTHVIAGENAKRTLEEHFVVLAHEKFPSDEGRWTLPVPEVPTSEASRRALAVWIDRVDDPTPLQAVGGWME